MLACDRRLQTGASVAGVQAWYAVPVAEEDRGTQKVERSQDHDHVRIDHVPRGHCGHQELEYQPDRGRPLHAAEAGRRGTQVAGGTAQETIPADIQRPVYRRQL